jgi:hypothetical protein
LFVGRELLHEVLQHGNAPSGIIFRGDGLESFILRASRGNHDARDLSACDGGREQNETEKPAFHAAPPDCVLEIVAPPGAGGKQKNSGP